MDGHSDFQSIRSILNFANANGRPFDKIQFRGGNEQHLGNVTSRLREFLASKQYVDFENKPNPIYETQLRRITFYLILNTEATFKYDLTEDVNIVHILQNCPQLSKFLLIHCIWSLQLHQFFYECISYAPHWFVWQFLEAAVDSLKDGDPFEILVRIEHLTTAIYLNIALADYRCCGTVDKKIGLRKYLDHTMDLLRHFYTSDAEKFSRWSKRLQAKYLGFMLYHTMLAIQRCFDYFLHKPAVTVDEKYRIFWLMNDREPILKSEDDSIYSAVTQDVLHAINVALLNSLQSNVMMVTLETYLEWAETDLDDEFTLQRQIGEIAYAVNELLNKHVAFAHDVSKQLKSIAVRPMTVLELARSAGIGEMIKKLDSLDLDEAIRCVWLTEFIDRGVFVLDNAECLETIEGNIEYLSLKHVQTMVTMLGSMQKCGALTDSDCHNKFKTILVTAVGKFQIPEIQQIIWHAITKTGSGETSISSANDAFAVETADYKAALIELFNKSGTALASKNSYVLMFQNPVRFHRHLLAAAIKSEQQQRDCLTFLATVPAHISQRYYGQCLREIVHGIAGLAVNERRLVPLLLAKMPGQYFQPARSFYQPFLYQLVLDATQTKDAAIIETILRALRLIVRSTDATCLEVAPPLLFMCASLIDQYRWDIITYNDQRQRIVEIGIDVLQTLQNRFLPIATANDKTFIVTKFIHLKPLTRYYLQKFALPEASASPLRFAEFMFGNEFANSPVDEQIELLLATMARCTSKECEWLARCNTLRSHMFAALRLFGRIVGQSQNVQNATDNLRHTTQCFVHVIKMIYVPACENPMALLMEVFGMMMDLSTHAIYETLLMDIQYVAADMIQQQLLVRSESTEDQCYQSISSAIAALPECEAKMLLQQKLVV